MNWSELISKNALDISSRLADYALEEREKGKGICPPQNQIFRALELTKPENVKVCIVGQDPYHTPGQANGLAFSIAPGNPIQPSLKNIFKELEQDLACGRPLCGDLTPWAERGVLLLNTTLTVYEHQPNSHANWGWKTFTIEILQAAHRLPQPVVFILWGADAINLLNSLIEKAAITEDNGYVVRENLLKKAFILSSHPSPLAASRKCKGYPPFLGSRPFSTTNRILTEFGGEPIDWKI